MVTKLTLFAWRITPQLRRMGVGESWILKNPFGFYWTKSLWCSLNGAGIWQWIIKDKYLENQSLVTWIEDGARVPGAISYMWWSKMKIKHWILGSLKWQITFGSGLTSEFGALQTAAGLTSERDGELTKEAANGEGEELENTENERQLYIGLQGCTCVVNKHHTCGNWA